MRPKGTHRVCFTWEQSSLKKCSCDFLSDETKIHTNLCWTKSQSLWPRAHDSPGVPGLTHPHYINYKKFCYTYYYCEHLVLAFFLCWKYITLNHETAIILQKVAIRTNNIWQQSFNSWNKETKKYTCNKSPSSFQRGIVQKNVGHYVSCLDVSSFYVKAVMLCQSAYFFFEMQSQQW